MRYYFVWILTCLLIVLGSSCRKDLEYASSDGNLEFSKDTIFLDTVFANIGSTTHTLKIYNRNRDDLEIPTIRLAQGQNSKYRLNVDGVAGKEFANIPIFAQDSIFVFIETNVPADNASEKEFLYTDVIQFDTGDFLQEVQLVTLVKDAIFIHPKTLADGTKEIITLGRNDSGEEIRSTLIDLSFSQSPFTRISSTEALSAERYDFFCTCCYCFRDEWKNASLTQGYQSNSCQKSPKRMFLWLGDMHSISKHDRVIPIFSFGDFLTRHKITTPSIAPLWASIIHHAAFKSTFAYNFPSNILTHYALLKIEEWWTVLEYGLLSTKFQGLKTRFFSVPSLSLLVNFATNIAAGSAHAPVLENSVYKAPYAANIEEVIGFIHFAESSCTSSLKRTNYSFIGLTISCKSYARGFFSPSVQPDRLKERDRSNWCEWRQEHLLFKIYRRPGSKIYLGHVPFRANKADVRVLLAQALSEIPDVLLIMDEQTTDLDYETIQWLEELFGPYENTLAARQRAQQNKKIRRKRKELQESLNLVPTLQKSKQDSRKENLVDWLRHGQNEEEREEVYIRRFLRHGFFYKTMIMNMLKTVADRLNENNAERQYNRYLTFDDYMSDKIIKDQDKKMYVDSLSKSDSMQLLPKKKNRKVLMLIRNVRNEDAYVVPATFDR
ncbi:hypothetical protein GQR58_029772 [Nymphon striatum]|nr:hypothetical protein GQR58_029772 [Nymphon striatum]